MAPDRAFALMREEVKRGWWDGALVDELEAMVQAPVGPELIGRYLLARDIERQQKFVPSVNIFRLHISNF